MKDFKTLISLGGQFTLGFVATAILLIPSLFVLGFAEAGILVLILFYVMDIVVDWVIDNRREASPALKRI